MIRKFECKNCRHQFEADDKGVVECPQCHSDNVDIAASHLPSWIWKAVGGIIALLLLVCAGWFLFQNDGQSEDNPPVAEFVSEDGDSVIVVEGLTVPPTVEVSTPVFNEENSTYSVEVSVKNMPQGYKFYYAMLNHFGEQKVMKKSEDGKFTDIPFNEEDGNSYDFAVCDAKTDTLLCAPVPQSGFLRQVKVKEKMTVAQLQQLIDNADETLMGKGENDYLAPDYKLNLKGLSSDAVNVPKVLADVIQKLKNEVWSKATVKSLEYDDMNRISVITIQAEEDDF